MPDPFYDPPTRAEMRTIIGRSLRDPAGEVFGPDILNDIINESLADLSGYRPVEATESIAYDPGTVPAPVPVPFFLTRLSSVWRVEVRNDARPEDISQSFTIPYDSGESQVANGWDVWEGALRLGRGNWVRLWNWYNGLGGDVITISAFGYRDRILPTADATVLDLFDGTDFLCMTKCARMLGFQTLNNDRALYQQWLAATNNTDVSPTQLQGMLNLAEGDYDRQRRRSSRLRRIPDIGPQYP
jgi:hypothetical protein